MSLSLYSSFCFSFFDCHKIVCYTCILYYNNISEHAAAILTGFLFESFFSRVFIGYIQKPLNENVMTTIQAI